MEVYIEEVQVTLREAKETTSVATHFWRRLMLRGLSGSRSPLCQVTSHWESSSRPCSRSSSLLPRAMSVGMDFSISRVDSGREEG